MSRLLGLRGLLSLPDRVPPSASVTLFLGTYTTRPTTMVYWAHLIENWDVSIRLPVPSKMLSVALFVPVGGYILHRLTSFPQPKNAVKVSPGLRCVPDGPLKTRVNELYPENGLGVACYADLPHGATKFTLLGPEDGRRVRIPWRYVRLILKRPSGCSNSWIQHSQHHLQGDWVAVNPPANPYSVLS